MGRTSRTAAAAIFALCAAATSSHEALPSEIDGEGIDEARPLDLPHEEDRFFREVVGELDVDDIHLTSAIDVDLDGDGDSDGAARDHLHHHGHVRAGSRNLQGGGDCDGLPSRFQNSLYITFNDVDAALDTDREFNLLIKELKSTLQICSGNCVNVEEINIQAQFFFEDRKRRRRNGRNWRKKAVFKAFAGGSCYRCVSGSEVPLVEDSMTRLRRLGGAAETGQRRLQQSCGAILLQGLKATGLEAFECITVAEISLEDPRCDVEQFREDEVEETLTRPGL